jgi:ferredoxin
VAHRRLKRIRVAVALVVIAGLTAALVDFRAAVPGWVGHLLASVQFVPALVAGLAAVWVALALSALVAGRIYCSALCPLGILQDGIARVASRWPRGRRGFRRYARPLTWLRQTVLWGTVAGVAVGGAGFTLSLVDPFSNFGRIAADLFRPALTLANNAVAGLANAAGVGTLYRVEPRWAGLGALHQPLLLLGLLVVLVVLRGRLYCNTLCPVGTLLGLLARRAAFRLTIDPAACSKCGDCLQACKAQCIDLRAQDIDFSRCVACYNCLGACREHGIGYRFSWIRRPRRPAPEPAAATPDPPRRAFLAEVALATAALGASRLRAAGRARPATGAAGPAAAVPAGETSRAICPPGAGSVDRFLERCTACHLCISACPTHVLQPAFLEYGFLGMMKPRLDFTQAPCTYTCRDCTAVCPDGALDRLELADKQLIRIGEARLDVERCIVKTQGTDCAACSEQCPTQAVTTVPYGQNLRLPQLNPDFCIGCGGCEFACPVLPRKAITVTGLRRHARARRPADPKAATPVPAGGFPF